MNKGYLNVVSLYLFTLVCKFVQTKSIVNALYIICRISPQTQRSIAYTETAINNYNHKLI